MKRLITCITIPVVIFVVVTLFGYQTIKEKSQEIKMAQKSVGTAKQFAQSLSFISPSALLESSVIMKSFPVWTEVLESACKEIDARWFGWLYPSGVKKKYIMPIIAASCEASTYFSQGSYQKVLEVYNNGPGRVVGTEPLIADLKDFGNRDITALEETFRKYKSDLQAYTIVKALVFVALAIVAVLLSDRVFKKKNERNY